jgi:hypothetical protein
MMEKEEARRCFLLIADDRFDVAIFLSECLPKDKRPRDLLLKRKRHNKVEGCPISVCELREDVCA